MSVRASTWPQAKLGDVLRQVARPLAVDVDGTYREIGIRSHGKGLFHKAPSTGAAIGDKRVFYVEPGDFVLNIVFAWEGAVGLVTESERGMIASHRFPTFRAVEGRIDLRFLERFFHTPAGLELLGRVSPGGAGRNRTLSRTAFMQQEIPLPPLPEQQRIVARIDEVAGQLQDAAGFRDSATVETEHLFALTRDRLFRSLSAPRVKIGECFRLINGRAFKPGEWSGRGKRIVRIQNLKYPDAPFNRYEGPVDERHIVRPGDVLFAWSGQIVSLGAHIWNGDVAILNQHIFNVRFGGELVAPFVRHGWNALVDEMKAQVRGLEMFHIRKQELDRMNFAIPGVAEQCSIVAELDALQAEVDALKRTQTQTRAELDALLPAILDRAFAGAL